MRIGTMATVVVTGVTVATLGCLPDDSAINESAVPIEGSGVQGPAAPAEGSAAAVEAAPSDAEAPLFEASRPEGASYAGVPADWPCRVEQGDDVVWYVYDPVMATCITPPGILGCPTLSRTVTTLGTSDTTYRYDEAGRLVEMTQARAEDDAPGLVQTYTYGEDNRVVTTHDASPLLGYDAQTIWTWDGTTSVVATTSMEGVEGQASMMYGFDNDGRLTGIALQRPGSAPAVTQMSFDAQGRVVEGTRAGRVVGRFIYCEE